MTAELFICLSMCSCKSQLQSEGRSLKNRQCNVGNHAKQNLSIGYRAYIKIDEGKLLNKTTLGHIMSCCKQGYSICNLNQKKSRSLNSLLFRKVLKLCTKCKPLLSLFQRKVPYVRIDFIKYKYMIKCSAELDPLTKAEKSLLFIYLKW